MPFVKNLAGQILYFYAYDANSDGKTGDSANLSGKLSLDGGAWNGLTNAISEDAYGWYKVTLDLSETNGDMARVRIISSTAGVKITPIIIHFTTYTAVKAGYLDAAVSTRAATGADGDTLKTLSDQLDTAQADLDNPDQYKANVSALALETGGNLADVKAKTDNLPADPASNTQVNTRLAAADYTAPDNTGIAALQEALTALAGIFPADPASQATVVAAIAALQTVLVGLQARVLAQNQPYPVTLDGSSSTTITYKQGEARPLALAVTDALGAVVDLSAATVLLGIKRDKGDADFTFAKLDADFDKTQAALGIVSVNITAADTGQTPAKYYGELKCAWMDEALVSKSADFYVQIERATT